jgi:hypothetical protein
MSQGPIFLTPPGRRATAAAVLGAMAALDPQPAGLLVSAVDLTAGAILVGVAKLSEDDARRILLDLWSMP